MKRNAVYIGWAMLALLLTALACSGSFSTANIGDAWLASDPDGQNRTTVFTPDAVFYLFVDLKNAPDDTKLKAVWIAVDAEGVEEKDLVLYESEFTSGSGIVYFTLENTDYLWPNGQYKVDLYLNDELAQTLTFEVR